jgi:hypothetical protein
MNPTVVWFYNKIKNKIFTLNDCGVVCYCRRVEVVDLLLKMGADVLCADHEGR